MRRFTSPCSLLHSSPIFLPFLSYLTSQSWVIPPPSPQVQDTTIICAPQLSQHLALAALSEEGSAYVKDQIAGLAGVKEC